MKHEADKKCRHVEFQLGDQVLVKLQPYQQSSVALPKYQKLSSCCFGSFSMLAKIGSVAYKLSLPSTAKLRPIFHVSQLKPFHGNIT